MARALLLGFLVGFPIAASPGPMLFLVLRRTLARGWRSGLSSGFGIATGDAVYAALAGFGVAAITNILIGQRRWIALAGGIALAVIGVRALVVQRDPPVRHERLKRSLGTNVSNARVALTSLTLVLHQRLKRSYCTKAQLAWGDAPSATRVGRRPERNSRGATPRAPLAWADGPAPARREGESKLPARGEGDLFPAYASMVALTLSNPPTILSFTAVFAGLGLRVGSGWRTALALVFGVMLGSAVWWVVVTVIASLIRERLTPLVMRGIAISSGLVLTAFGVVIAVHAL